MTILDVKNQLVTHFLKHDTYDPTRHAFEVTYDKETADFREELTKEALIQLDAQGFVKKLSKEGKDIWVLVQPIGAYVQQVSISPIIADMMASIVNFHNELDEIDFVVDKTKIDEGVIGRLLNIVSEYDDMMMEQEEKAHGKQDDEEGDE